jgi:hypothetical protein
MCLGVLYARNLTEIYQVKIKLLSVGLHDFLEVQGRIASLLIWVDGRIHFLVVIRLTSPLPSSLSKLATVG